MAATPWWATVLVGVLTVAGAGLGAWIGAGLAVLDTLRRPATTTKTGRPSGIIEARDQREEDR